MSRSVLVPTLLLAFGCAAPGAPTDDAYDVVIPDVTRQGRTIANVQRLIFLAPESEAQPEFPVDNGFAVNFPVALSR